MYAVVDIETTGGHASLNGITEISIVLHNGKAIESVYTTLINPNIPIPTFVQSLTGITNEMVANAPQFTTVAPTIYNLLKDRIFTAHNVNFDYSFIKHHLAQAGFDLDVPKLCTIRAARKIFPGFLKYGLGSICRELNIQINNRHRAEGDATATAILLTKLLQQDSSGVISRMTGKKNAQGYLPPNITEEIINELPETFGVYYFLDKKGKIVYIGKAKNIKQRVLSHFSNNSIHKQKQDFLRTVYNITYKICASELMASIVESIEIKKYWPIFNKSHKRNEKYFGLYVFEDGKGYWRLVIDNRKKNLVPLHTFSSLLEARQTLKRIIDQFELCAKMCFIDLSEGKTLPEIKGELPQQYNKKVNAALKYLKEQLPSFVIVEEDAGDKHLMNCILIENGRFAGIGNVPKENELVTLEDYKQQIEIMPENAFVRNLVFQYAQKYPQHTIAIKPLVA